MFNLMQKAWTIWAIAESEGVTPDVAMLMFVVNMMMKAPLYGSDEAQLDWEAEYAEWGKLDAAAQRQQLYAFRILTDEDEGYYGPLCNHYQGGGVEAFWDLVEDAIAHLSDEVAG